MTDQWENDLNSKVPVRLAVSTADLHELADMAQERNESKIYRIMDRHQYDWSGRVVIHDWDEDNNELVTYLGREGEGEGECETLSPEQKLLGEAVGIVFTNCLLRRVMDTGASVYQSKALQLRLSTTV